MRALIVEDGLQRSALAVTRALARAGWFVGNASPVRGFSAWSRYSSTWHPTARPAEDLDAFTHSVQEAISTHGYEVLFGAGDAEIVALSLQRDHFAAIVPYPEQRVLLNALDKLALARAASAAHFASPRTTPADRSALARVDGPVIVKSRLHWLPGQTGSSGHVDAVRAATRSEAVTGARAIELAGGEPILQESIEGSLLAYSALVDGSGRTVAEVQQIADRTWPPGAGVSARAITLPVDPSISKRVSILCGELGWRGLAEIQFILPPGGEPHLIDLNGRFYGSVELAIAAGVDFPVLWGALALGRNIPSTYVGKPGVRYQWLEGDLRRALRERRGGLGRDLFDCLVTASRSHHSVWSLKDPSPALRHASRLLGRRVRKASA